MGGGAPSANRGRPSRPRLRSSLMFCSKNPMSSRTFRKSSVLRTFAAKTGPVSQIQKMQKLTCNKITTKSPLSFGNCGAEDDLIMPSDADKKNFSTVAPQCQRCKRDNEKVVIGKRRGKYGSSA